MLWSVRLLCSVTSRKPSHAWHVILFRTEFADKGREIEVVRIRHQTLGLFSNGKKVYGKNWCSILLHLFANIWSRISSIFWYFYYYLLLSFWIMGLPVCSYTAAWWATLQICRSNFHKENCVTRQSNVLTERSNHLRYVYYLVYEFA